MTKVRKKRKKEREKYLENSISIFHLKRKTFEEEIISLNDTNFSCISFFFIRAFVEQIITVWLPYDKKRIIIMSQCYRLQRIRQTHTTCYSEIFYKNVSVINGLRVSVIDINQLRECTLFKIPSAAMYLTPLLVGMYLARSMIT